MKLSLIIPTRSRAIYLESALASALVAAERAGCPVEIVISDNASEDDTAAVVARAASPILRYVRQPVRLSMRQNFQAALEASTGSHVIFIGDDDGVAPNGLLRLREMIEGEDRDIYKWRVANVFWPDPTRGTPGRMALRTTKFSGRVRHIDPMALFADFARARFGSYQNGGMIYHGCVSRRLVDRLSAVSEGTYFWTSCPDVHASVANLLLCDGPILAADIPVTVGGASPRSNGTAGQEFNRSGGGQTAEYARFVAELAGDACLGALPASCNSVNLVTINAMQLATRFTGKTMPLDEAAWRIRVERETQGLAPALKAEVAAQTDLLFGQATVPARPATVPPVPAAVPPAPPAAAAPARPSVKVTWGKVSLSGGRALDTIAQASALIDRLCLNHTPFRRLPRGPLGMAARILRIRAAAAALAKTDW